MTGQKIVILGAGLAGLSSAAHLSTDNYEIYEKERKVGGLCRSVTIDDFVFDYGPHILFPEEPYCEQLIKTLLRDNLRIETREAWIYHKKFDVFTVFPFQAHMYGLPVSLVLEFLKDLYAAIMNNGAIRAANYEEWMYKKFGKGITEYLMIPYAKKIWTVEPKDMSYVWIDRRVPQPNFEIILEGALTDTIERVGANKKFWYPLEGGIEALPKSLLQKVNNVKLSMEATRIFLKEKKIEFNGKAKVPYELLISTLTLPQVIKLIKDDVPSAVKMAADNLKHNSILCVNLGVERKNISKYHWLYFHESDFVFHRINFPMNLSPLTTPKGKSSISCEIAYSKYRPINKETIIERTIEDLIKSKILFKDDKILVSDVLDIECAYIIYDLNHRKNVDTIHEYLRQNDIYSCGRFGEWEYFNMDHSIMSGKRTANKINKFLSTERAIPIVAQKSYTPTCIEEDKKTPLVSIVILNWNRLEDTIECLKSVKKIDYLNYEIVVVDNGSTDESPEKIKQLFPEITLVRNKENLGYAEGNNIGIRYALKKGSPYIFILNNDTIVDSQILKSFLEAEKLFPNAGVFGAKCYYYSEPNKIWYAGGKWDDKKKSLDHIGYNELDEDGKFSKIQETDYACGAAVFVKAEVFKKVGLFDARLFLTHEDPDFCFRTQRVGFKCIFTPEAKIWHKVSVSFGGKGPLYAYFFTRNRLLCAQKNLSFLKKLSVYMAVIKEFFPCVFTLNKHAVIKRLYWDILNLKKSSSKAKLFGMKDFVFRNFGNCPAYILQLNKSK